MIFDCANQLNRDLEFINNGTSNCLMIAELDLSATSNFLSASEFCKVGIKLLELVAAFLEHYMLALKLTTLQTQVVELDTVCIIGIGKCCLLCDFFSLFISFLTSNFRMAFHSHITWTNFHDLPCLSSTNSPSFFSATCCSIDLCHDFCQRLLFSTSTHWATLLCIQAPSLSSLTSLLL
jgi:hypothetical protein